MELSPEFNALPIASGRHNLEAKLAELGSLVAFLQQNPQKWHLVAAISDHSPFLWRLCVADPSRLERVLTTAPDALLAQLLANCFNQCEAMSDVTSLMKSLRLCRQEVALLVALADLAGIWSLDCIIKSLSEAAEIWIRVALRFLLRQAAENTELLLDPLQDIEAQCGLTVLALGKLGANELNYSSDVDLIVLFEWDTFASRPIEDKTSFFVKMIKALVKILQEHTAKGFVLRVDLRLRPDPGSTAIALSTATAENYYETFGQNWERAAMIKARPIAGDLAVGQRFLKHLRPFVWRKYFDFAAIYDIHAMKRQIHAAKGFAVISLLGHDIKLGRGGIREIEFFVQTQQLIFGGKRPQLRGRQTLSMLQALHDDGWIDTVAVNDLSQAYRFLREIEHRLQMLRDEQTQRLPNEAKEFSAFAKFCGYRSTRRFSKILSKHLHNVERHYARLFEHAPSLGTQNGNLVFTGVTDDPETLRTLAGMGYRHPEKATEMIRGWHFGRRLAVRSARAREILTELVPLLITSFASSIDPDAALENFDHSLMHLRASVELFSLLRENSHLRELYADLLGGAPHMAAAVTARPHVLDALIAADVGEPSSANVKAQQLKVMTQSEDFLDKARDLAQEELFLTGVKLFAGHISPTQAGLFYTRIAERIISAALAQVEHDMEAEYGKIPGGTCAVLAMGRLGSSEMTAKSDLDLILIFDFDEKYPESDGLKSLHAMTYYARLTQRLISALTVSTSRGGLYVVDLRLRPSGGKGPLATQYQSFVDYQLTQAETWEHMALTRGRPIAGDKSLCRRLARSISRILRKNRDLSSLRKDVEQMRSLVAKVKGENDATDLKLASGGILDIEFIAQYLILAHARNFTRLAKLTLPQLLSQSSELGLIGPAEVETLMQAYQLYTSVVHLQRLTLDSTSDPKSAGRAVQRRIAQVANCPDFPQLLQHLKDNRQKVRAIFKKIFR